MALLVRRMTDAGAPPEAIVIALEAIEAEQAKMAAARAKRAAQKRKERDKIATVVDMSRDIEATVDATVGDIPLSPKECPRTPIETTPISTLASLGTHRGREAFLEFKSVYPRREGSQPWAAAEKKFLAAVGRGPDAESIAAAIIRGAAAYAESVRYDDPKFVAQAATWLNQRRWLDEHVPPMARGSPVPFAKPPSAREQALRIVMEEAREREIESNSPEGLFDSPHTIEQAG